MVNKLRQVMAAVWRGLRTWSGDDAYERYVANHQEHDHGLVSRREFYRNYFVERANRPRCC